MESLSPLIRAKAATMHRAIFMGMGISVRSWQSGAYAADLVRKNRRGTRSAKKSLKRPAGDPILQMPIGGVPEFIIATPKKLPGVPLANNGITGGSSSNPSVLIYLLGRR